MSISYLDVISAIYHNYDYILSPNMLTSLLGNADLSEKTKGKDRCSELPVPHYSKEYHFNPKETSLGIIDADFCYSDKLVNCSVLLHFGSMNNIETAQSFYNNNLLPYVTKLVVPAMPIPNLIISGHTFNPKNLELSVRWVTGLPSCCTYLTLLD